MATLVIRMPSGPNGFPSNAEAITFVEDALNTEYELRFGSLVENKPIWQGRVETFINFVRQMQENDSANLRIVPTPKQERK